MKKVMLLALIASASLYANEIKLEKSVIKGTGTFEGSITSGESKNMVIITEKDIKKKNYSNMVDIFKDSPFTVVTHTPAGTVVALRGSGEKTIMRVKVFVDGNPISPIDENMGIIPFNSIPVNSIKKIEIIPGGGITLYGSGSSSGVINIVTKMGVEKKYGIAEVSMGSYDNYKAEISKGIKITDKLFANVSLEAKKSKGYREDEKNKRANAMLGLNYNINDKNRIRLSGSYFDENEHNTNEAYLSQIKKNRKVAGNTKSKTDSKRYAFGIDYEYRPTENLKFIAGYNQSKLTRDVTADSKPRITFISGGEWLEKILKPQDGYGVNIVAENLENKVKGEIKENIKNTRFKAEYDYKDKNGKFIFGASSNKHRIERNLDVNVEPLGHEELKFLVTEDSRRDFSLEDLRDGEKMYSNAELFTFSTLIGGGKAFENPKLSRKFGDYIASLSSEKTKKAYEDSGHQGSVLIKDENFNKNMWKGIEKFSNEKVADTFTLAEENGEKGLYVSDGFIPETSYKVKQQWIYWGDPYKFVKVPKNLKIKDFQNYFSPPKEAPADLKMANISNAYVDVKKDTNSFYLYNSYPVTSKLNINTGLRYEKARYKGTRHSETKLRMTGNPELRSTANYIQGYLNLAAGENTKKRYYEVVAEKMAELKENGFTDIKMANLSHKFDKKEENVGGELGFDYKLNDTDTVYARYERAFNTPLPAQLTNKSIHPVYKVKMYWESGLKTEKMNNFEIGVRGMIGNNVTYSLSGFMSDTHDEIISIVKDGQSHASREWRFINLDKTRRIGLELESQQIFDKLTLRESFTYVEPKVVLNRYEDRVKQIVAGQVDEEKTIYKNSLDDYFKISLELGELKNLSEENKQVLIKNYIPYLRENLTNFEGLNLQDPFHHPEDRIKFSEELDKATEGIENNVMSKITNMTQKQKDELKNNLEGDLYQSARNYIDYTYNLFKLYNAFNGAGSNIKKGDRIPLAPKIKMTFGADYQFTDRLKLGVNTTYIGSYFTAEPDRIYSIIKTKVPSHWVADLYGTYTLNDDFSVKFGINNAFNHKYYLRQDSKSALPAQGRTYNLGVTYRF